MSSSRHDGRADSPHRSRKHPRTSATSSDSPSQRPRLDDDDEDDDETFRARNGMENGGVYAMENYYPTNEGSSYTPHLIPMFNQPPPYDSLHDPNNHLEDASVLLSMAYPSGMPGNDAPADPMIAGQRVVPDWSAGETINMMMNGASASATGDTASSNGGESGNGQGVTTTMGGSGGARNPSRGSTVPVNDSMINMFGSANATAWLTSALAGLKDNDNPNAWPAVQPSPRPVSPFPLSSMFSPSTFGLEALNGGEDENQESIMAILEQLQAYDRPQTRNSPNPERPLLRLDHTDIFFKAGPEISRTSKFFLPSDRFTGCYQIPHWALPPLRTLSLMANKTFNTVLNHFPFVHMPTFRLIDTAACLAFAICTVGGIRSGKQQHDELLGKGANGIRHYADAPSGTQLFERLMDGPVSPDQSWESMYKANYEIIEDEEAEDIKHVGRWDTAPVVRNEKTNMLIKVSRFACRP